LGVTCCWIRRIKQLRLFLPDVDKFFGLGVGSEVVDVDYQRVKRDDLTGVSVRGTGADEVLRTHPKFIFCDLAFRRL
jgi:hypothetical protein